MQIGPYETHPASDLFPLMTGSELDALARDIRANGLRTPIVLCEGRVLDGRNRLLACERAGVKPRFEEWQRCGSELAWLVSINLHRRHLNAGQRGLIAARLADALAADAARRRGTRTDLGAVLDHEDRGKVSAKAGALLHVSGRTVEHARAVLRHGAPGVIEAVRSGDLAVSAAAAAALAAVNRGRDPAIHVRSGGRERGREARVHRPVDRRAGTFAVLSAFPDWGAPEQYERLRRLSVARIAAPNATAFVWTPSVALAKGLTLLFRWGFEYVASIVCIRSRPIDGQFTRERHDLVLIGALGDSPPRPAVRDLPDSVVDVGELDAAARRRKIAERVAASYPDARKAEILAPAPLPGWESAP